MIGTLKIKIKIAVPAPGDRTLSAIYTDRDVTEDEAREMFARWKQQNPALADSARGEWTARVVF